MTLADFLLARIAEDEAAAADARNMQDYMPPGAWGLDRVLAECAAKRAVMGLHLQLFHTDRASWYYLDQGDGPKVETWRSWASCESCESWAPAVEWVTVDGVSSSPPQVNRWCPTLRALAAVYADHPDYRDEWRP